jgi:hypothetical protein
MCSLFLKIPKFIKIRNINVTNSYFFVILTLFYRLLKNQGGEERLLGLMWHLGVYAPFACQGRFLPSTPPAHK